MVFVGDNLIHWTIQQSGIQTAQDGTVSRNYDHLYREIAPFIRKADIAVINQEVVTGGDELGLGTYPSFNVPYEFADAVSHAGFDVATMATNHILDRGTEGVTNMLSYWHSHVPNVMTTGAYASQAERDALPIYDFDSMKIAFLNYTYDSNSGGGPNYYTLNMLSNREQLTNDIKRAKEEADYVIVCPHWGNENYEPVTAKQQELTQLFSDLGVDLVVGTHPHILQKTEHRINAEGKDMYVFYSLGNFISLQNHTNQMLGGIADVTIHRDEWGKITVTPKMDFCVTHFRYDPSILLYYDICTYRWEDYTPELAKVHGLNMIDDSFSYEALRQMVTKYSVIQNGTSSGSNGT